MFNILKKGAVILVNDVNVGNHKIMTLIEANEIFKVWKEWYYPCHFLLDSVFGPEIPESFLPYPKDVLEEALNIVAKDFFDRGDIKTSKDIQKTMISIYHYLENEKAWEKAAKLFSNPEMMRAMLGFVENFKKDYISWLKNNKKPQGS